jgi:hypothetical protein
MEDPPEGRNADKAVSPEAEPANGVDATATAGAGAATGQMGELPTDDSQEESSESVAGNRARRELQVILDILPSLKAEIADPSKLSDEIALKKLAEIFARLDSAAGVPQTIEMTGLPSGFAVGAPDIFPIFVFREKNESLPEGPEQLKNDFGYLAHVVNFAETENSTAPDGSVDGFLRRLRTSSEACGWRLDTMENILIASRDYTLKRVTDLRIRGMRDIADTLQLAADGFEALRVRYCVPRGVGAPAPAPIATAEPTPVEQQDDALHGQSAELTPPDGTDTQPELQERARRRQAVVYPLWEKAVPPITTSEQWAARASNLTPGDGRQIDGKTPRDYLSGKTRLQPKSVLWLAKAINITPEELPD